MDIAELTIHVNQFKEDKFKDSEEFYSKRYKTPSRESSQQKIRNVNQPCFKHKPNDLAASFSSDPTPKKKYILRNENFQSFKTRPTKSIGSVSHGVTYTQHMLNVAKTAQKHVMMAPMDASSVVRQLHSIVP